jgi:hypothetical protein
MHDFAPREVMTRAERIEVPVCSGGQLVAALMQCGPINADQASLIIEATVRAVVANATFGEICEAARRVVVDLGKHDGRENQQHENHPGNR